MFAASFSCGSGSRVVLCSPTNRNHEERRCVAMHGLVCRRLLREGNVVFLRFPVTSWKAKQRNNANAVSRVVVQTMTRERIT